MPAHRLAPDATTLRLWLNEGLTHQEIADRQTSLTGERVSRSTISAAVSRLGLSKQAPRYDEELPWRVKVQHIKAYPARMLRLLGKRRSGVALTEDESKRLDAWLQLLSDNDAVVAYAPDSEEGFVYVARNPVDSQEIPIRVQLVKVVGEQ